STLSSLQAGATDCDVPEDHSAYWVPSLYHNGVKIDPTTLSAYYTLGNRTAGAIQPFPTGLRVVAGNSTATTSQGEKITSWACIDASGGSKVVTQTFPTCQTGSHVVLRVRFPDCW